jgi:PPM family protein phosphatase
MMLMDIQASGLTDVGRKRQHNEDCFAIDDTARLYMVCDGMGGHAAGELASSIAVSTVRAVLVREQEVIKHFDGTGKARDDLLRVVEMAVREASTAVFERARAEPDKKGMGTTLTMVLATDTVGAMAHVGDTRLYLRRQERLHQLSEDHTYVAEAVRRGLSTAAEAKAGPYANVVTRAVGIHATVRVDTLLFDMLPGDTLLICSDGLHRYFEDNHELTGMLGGDHLAGIPKQLVDLANHRGGIDNVTAVLMRVEGDSDIAAASARTTDVTLRIDSLQLATLFRDLTMNELYQLLNIATLIELRAGEQLLTEGERSDGMYLLTEGEVSVQRGGQQLAVLRRGDHVGEMMLFRNRPRSATVAAITACKLLRIERTRLFELVRKEPVLGVKVMWSVAQALSSRLDDVSALLANQEPRTVEELVSPFRREP